MTLTAETLATLRRLDEEATPGPWRAVSRCSGVDDSRSEYDDWFLGWEIEPLETPQRGQIERGADAHLIAALRNYAAELIRLARLALAVAEADQRLRQHFYCSRCERTLPLEALHLTLSRVWGVRVCVECVEAAGGVATLLATPPPEEGARE